MDLSPASKNRTYLATIAGALLCVCAALFFDSFNWPAMSPDVRLRAILLDIFLPIALAVPLIFFFMNKLRELRALGPDFFPNS